jgi:hypothetical protein
VAFLAPWLPENSELVSFFLETSALGLPISVAGFLAGLVLSLVVPRRARLGRWTATFVVGLIVGVVLLGAAFRWREMPFGITAVGWKEGKRLLVLTGLAALLVAHLGYALYLAGVARRFASPRLARCIVVFFACLALQVALVTLVEAALGYWKHPWIPHVRMDWRYDLVRCSAAMLVGMGTIWAGVLWRLRQCMPRAES